MWHPCLCSTCLDNVRGQCFAGGCDRNPSREEREDYFCDLGDDDDGEDGDGGDEPDATANGAEGD